MTSGILNVLKPCGMTSHDVVGFLRRTLQTKKIGHGGTPLGSSTRTRTPSAQR